MAVVVVFVFLSAVGRAATPPKYDHVVIIFEENKDYGQVIGSANAPYINKTLLGDLRRRAVHQHARRGASEPTELSRLFLRLEPGGDRRPPA